ncbi:hypothetical protein ANO11243_041770 [Dothideomycetidae sp. 11243]|nr:hypothetical protein ANO11243_041770 [fungal sp. No.11243]
MSRFVAGGTVDQPATQRSAEWLAAQSAIEAKAAADKAKSLDQSGGQSLYEVLQANKAAKQEAFEESIKLKNQFRALDASEVDFLSSVSERARAAEAQQRRETEAQLAAFRAKRDAAATAPEALAEGEKQPDHQEDWATAGRKRRRGGAAKRVGPIKVRRTSSTTAEQADAVGHANGHAEANDGEEKLPKITAPIDKKSSAGGGLGLGGYSSSDDDDD